MVREPIQQGSGEPLRAEILSPFVEGQIASDQCGLAFKAAADRPCKCSVSPTGRRLPVHNLLHLQGTGSIRAFLNKKLDLVLDLLPEANKTKRG